MCLLSTGCEGSAVRARVGPGGMGGAELGWSTKALSVSLSVQRPALILNVMFCLKQSSGQDC